MAEIVVSKLFYNTLLFNSAQRIISKNIYCFYLFYCFNASINIIEQQPSDHEISAASEKKEHEYYHGNIMHYSYQEYCRL